MNRKRLCIGTLAAGLSLAFGQGCEKHSDSGTSNGSDGSSSAKTLKFSAIPDQEKKNLEEFNAIASHLSQELDMPVEYVASDNYNASVTAFRNGDIQLAWFDGLTGVQAREFVQGAKAIAQGDVDLDSVAYIIADAGAGVEPSAQFPKQIGDLNFTFGEPQSSSGRLMPQFFIEKETGMPIEQFFTKHPVPSFSANDDDTCVRVAGAWQAGVVDSRVYDRRVADGRTDPNLVKVVWKTPPFADYHWTAHPDLEKTYGAGFTDRLRKAIIGMTTKAPELLEAFPRKAMIPANNGDYGNIKAVAADLGFLN